MLPSNINPHFDLHRTLDGSPSPTTGTCTGPKLQHHPTSNAAHRFRHTLLELEGCTELRFWEREAPETVAAEIYRMKSAPPNQLGLLPQS